MLLSAQELATLWTPQTPSIGDRIERVMARWLPVPSKAFTPPDDPRFLRLGMGEKSDGSLAPIGMRYDMLRYILWVTAPMGRGKSEWLKNMFDGLLCANAGFMALDCKGTDLVNGTLPLIPLNREGDVTILDLGGTTITGEDMRASMNLLSPKFGMGLGLKFSQLASTVLQIFVTLDPKFEDAPGMRQFANYGLLALLEGEPNATLMHLIRFFGDEDYRADICGKLRPGQVKDFWNRRFDEMPDSQKASLTSFERRLDQLLTYPELAAMLVAPGCSIDLRQLMDNRGILLAGIKATEGQIASIAATLLLTQLTLAALSRNNVPSVEDPEGFNPYRPDWPMIVDEFQIIADANESIARVMLSQFRAFRIGTVLVHQNVEQVKRVLGPLQGNAQNRLILGSEIEDATKYGNDYSALGVTKEDFLSMERFQHEYIKIYGTDAALFSARMPPLIKSLDEPAPPPEYRNWRAVRAPARNARDQKLDAEIARFREYAALDSDSAMHRLGMLCKTDPGAFHAYCERTKAHRAAQRQFILEYPGCIPMDMTIDPEVARVKQKEDRIRLLSTLRANLPRIETEAMAFALLLSAQEAAETRAARAEAEKAAKQAWRKGGKGAPKPARSPEIAGMQADSLAPPPGAVEIGTATSATVRLDAPVPQPAVTLKQLQEQRRARGRREANDLSAGFDALMGEE
jgi:hypothetical protein